MSTYFTADPHLGHRAIAKYRKFVSSTEENTELYINDWKRVIRKRDTIYMLGDVAFDNESLDIISNLPGTKILIKGNHDDYVKTSDHASVFKEIHGIISYKGFWLSHCPIHPAEIRRRKANIHGHVHENSITTGLLWRREHPQYVNVCVDYLYPRYNTCFISLEKIKERF